MKENTNPMVNEKNLQNDDTNNGNPKGESIIDVFRSPVLFKRLVIMFLAW